jgi:hypothetical protein
MHGSERADGVQVWNGPECQAIRVAFVLCVEILQCPVAVSRYANATGDWKLQTLRGKILMRYELHMTSGRDWRDTYRGGRFWDKSLFNDSPTVARNKVTSHLYLVHKCISSTT